MCVAFLSFGDAQVFWGEQLIRPCFYPIERRRLARLSVDDQYCRRFLHFVPRPVNWSHDRRRRTRCDDYVARRASGLRRLLFLLVFLFRSSARPTLYPRCRVFLLGKRFAWLVGLLRARRLSNVLVEFFRPFVSGGGVLLQTSIFRVPSGGVFIGFARLFPCSCDGRFGLWGRLTILLGVWSVAVVGN